jgi:phosphohistidine swiveling domain-containing protein
MKKISQLPLRVLLSVCGLSVVSYGVICNEQESTLSLEIVVDENEEKEVVAVGTASVGNSAVTGKACVVISKKQLKKISKGDIVIASALQSSWYPSLSQIAGIITEKGDEESNALLLGKKFNIPVIVGASGALKKIIDDQIITLDPIAKNIYHVSYSETSYRGSDDIMQLHEDPDKLNLDKLINNNKKYKLHRELYNHDVIISHGLLPKQNVKQKTSKDAYISDFKQFKEYVFQMKFDLYKASWLPDAAFRLVAERRGCNSFATDCVEFARLLFKNSDRYIVDLMWDVANNLEDFDVIMEECNKNPGDLNKVAEVCHGVNVNSVTLPTGVDKQILITKPNQYIGIEKRFSNKNDQEKFKKERDTQTLKGLYIRFMVEIKKIHQSRSQ